LILFGCVSYITRNSVDVVPKEDNIRKTDYYINDIVLSQDEQYAYFYGNDYRFYEDRNSRRCDYIIKVDRKGNIVAFQSGKEGNLHDDLSELKSNDEKISLHQSKSSYYRSINTTDGGLFAASFADYESKPVVNYYKSSTVPELYNIVFDVFYYAKNYWYAFIILIIIFTGMVESVKEQKKEKAMQ
jgi:hypothetical protein